MRLEIVHGAGHGGKAFYDERRIKFASFWPRTLVLTNHATPGLSWPGGRATSRQPSKRGNDHSRVARKECGAPRPGSTAQLIPLWRAVQPCLTVTSAFANRDFDQCISTDAGLC